MDFQLFSMDSISFSKIILSILYITLFSTNYRTNSILSKCLPIMTSVVNIFHCYFYINLFKKRTSITVNNSLQGNEIFQFLVYIIKNFYFHKNMEIVSKMLSMSIVKRWLANYSTICFLCFFVLYFLNPHSIC